MSDNKNIDLSGSQLTFPKEPPIVTRAWCQNGTLCSVLCDYDDCQYGCSGQCTGNICERGCQFWVGVG